MDFNDLLLKKNFDPKEVLVLRHRPTEPKLRKVILRLAEVRHELFNAYQQTQSPRVERAFERASYVASFVGHEPGQAVFIGLYSIGEATRLTHAEYWRVPAYVEMREKYGLEGWSAEEARSHILWFDLTHTDFFARWKGRLIIEWPPPEVAWCRRAERNRMPIRSILSESILEPPAPNWRDIDLEWADLTALPPSLKAKLVEWRGIYYIFDPSDCKGYVGAAYGSQNLLGRWLNYAASGHGGNSLLRGRDPRNFRFSILQRVSPDEEPQDVQNLERTWKLRLHTRAPFGLNDN